MNRSVVTFSVTTDGFNVTAGSGNDSSEDTPSNNFCTLNPQDLGSGTLINGNLETYPLNAGYAVRGINFVFIKLFDLYFMKIFIMKINYHHVG